MPLFFNKRVSSKIIIRAVDKKMVAGLKMTPCLRNIMEVIYSTCLAETMELVLLRCLVMSVMEVAGRM